MLPRKRFPIKRDYPTFATTKKNARQFQPLQLPLPCSQRYYQYLQLPAYSNKARTDVNGEKITFRRTVTHAYLPGNADNGSWRDGEAHGMGDGVRGAWGCRCLRRGSAVLSALRATETSTEPKQKRLLLAAKYPFFYLLFGQNITQQKKKKRTATRAKIIMQLRTDPKSPHL